ncbi:hypothetical protein NE172_15110 [Clostridium botulinum]|uniref:IrrE N-terminal-like domain-containing protein n=1 Tax=Clostridium botulinum TaxID=1491 RepID=A0A6B4JKJ9_CLOBO|nr:hypothetical protein [Clostridium botulinum]EES48524.1 hypothetical protein CLO_0928 [Clostridium botulinum E1 str. 'BoNT E Beluga']MBY6760099.1 hypothetical protein [Clostridium botulinum]MBY6919008.1 hypothetical protein [Clostridium botulinum]MCR1132267.1 hypothetical protein [Clostridium botulinum]NFJ57347.1 hypothetical protein [Clostridium botulinum]
MNIENENLNNLIKEVYDKEEFIYIDEEINKEHGLMNESPARLAENKIFILKTLSNEEKMEAIAHEVGHVLLMNRKLIGVSIYHSYQHNFFAAMLNNLISHKELIEVLKNEFNIGSIMHLKLQKEALLNKSIENRIHNASSEEELYGIGFQLYDICRTTGEIYNAEIEKLINSNECVNKSFKASKMYLNDINSSMDEEEQIKRVIYMFKELSMLELITSFDCVDVYMKENVIDLVKQKVGELFRENKI